MPKEAMDSALSSPRGIKLTFSTEREALLFRSRCNTARKSERTRNERDTGDPTCEWDALMLSVHRCDLFITQQGQNIVEVTEL